MKSVSITFDTVIEMINDNNITSGMTVICLGHDNITDNKGGIYRIYSIQDLDSAQTEEDIILKSNNKLFAKKISNTIFDDVSKIHHSINELYENNDAIKTELNSLKEQISHYHEDTSVDNIPEPKDDNEDTTIDNDNINVLDLLEECGVSVTSYLDGTKIMFVDDFVPETDRSNIIYIDGVNDDLTRVIVDGREYPFDVIYTYIDPNGIMYNYDNVEVIITYGSIIIEGVNEDMTKVIINEELVDPVEKVIYTTNDDISYTYNGDVLYEVTPVDSIDFEHNLVIINYDEIEPESGVIYIDIHGVEYTYDGARLVANTETNDAERTS